MRFTGIVPIAELRDDDYGVPCLGFKSYAGLAAAAFFAVRYDTGARPTTSAIKALAFSLRAMMVPLEASTGFTYTFR